MERSILNLRLKDRIPIKTIRGKTKIKDVGYLVKSMKFRYVGHVNRSTDQRWSKLLMEWWPYGVPRNPGRPSTRYLDEIRNRVGIDWRRVSDNRKRWHRTGEVYAQMWAI